MITTSKQLRERHQVLGQASILKSPGFTTNDKYGRPRAPIGAGEYVDTNGNGAVDFLSERMDWTDRRTYTTAEPQLMMPMWPQFPPMETLKARADMMGTDILTADQLQDVGVGRVNLSWGGFRGPEAQLAESAPMNVLMPLPQPGQKLSYALDFSGEAPQFLIYDLK